MHCRKPDLYSFFGACYYFTAIGSSPFAAILRMSCVTFIEQNFGPHIEQNFADLNTSCGSVSSCIARAVSGSSDNSNCRFQSNSNRAFDNSSSRLRAFLRPRAMSAGVSRDLVGDHALAHIVLVRQAEMLLGRDVAKHGRSRLAGQGGADG